MFRNKKLISFSTAIFVVILLFSHCVDFKESNDPRGALYAGSETCVNCHKNISDSYLHTAHYASTKPATANAIHGSFAKDSNEFVINKNTKVVMEKRDSGTFQVLYVNGKEEKAYPFNIVFGGLKGETYLYWKGNELLQLPISYSHTFHKWTSSPGYSRNEVDFTRRIGTRCFECHSSYANLPDNAVPVKKGKQLNKASIIYNIDCERCHGPAADHVTFHTENPRETTPQFITARASLSRNQKIDMCAQCHSGNKTLMLRSIFNFLPGDTLAHYMVPEFTKGNDKANLDVHGNQTQLLKDSRCFIMSKMDCNTCHNTHKKERGNAAIFNHRCMDCHKNPKHSFDENNKRVNADFTNNNCIKCHMPVQPSNSISVFASDDPNPIYYKIVNHKIAVYPEETKKWLMNGKVDSVTKKTASNY